MHSRQFSWTAVTIADSSIFLPSLLCCYVKTSTLDAPNTPGQYILSYSFSLLCFPVVLHPGSRTGLAGDGDSGSGAHKHSTPGLAQSLLLPFKTLRNHLRNLCTEKGHFSHHFKATQDCAFLRQMLPSPLPCHPDPPAKQEAQDDPATTDPTVYVCLLLIFYQSSDLSHQAAAWWTEPKEIRAFMQEGN